MTTQQIPIQPSRTNKRTPRDPLAAGLPDPRPVTEYDVTYEEVDGRSRLVVVLDSVCVVADGPLEWGVVDCVTGGVKRLAGRADPDRQTTVLVFEYESILEKTFNFVLVPHQDPAVRNAAGGFVRPGARWFRPPEL